MQELKHQLNIAESALGMALRNCGPQEVLDVLPLKLIEVPFDSSSHETLTCTLICEYLPVPFQRSVKDSFPGLQVSCWQSYWKCCMLS